MNDDELIARADANYFDAWASIAVHAASGEVRERDGLRIVASGLPIAAFNVAFVMRKLAEPKRAISDTVTYFDAHRLPFIVRVRDGVDPVSERVCEGLGLPYTDSVPGLILPAITRDQGTTTDLEIRPVDASNAADHAVVLASSFGMPTKFARQLLALSLLTMPDVRFYVAYDGERPVATSALLASHRVAGVYNVACIEEYRRRGIGEAMTWHAVREGASSGCVMSSLQASAMGRPIYERMGFRLMAQYRTFMRPEV